jgi:rhamnosyltransferase
MMAPGEEGAVEPLQGRPPERNNICALIVTYHPDEELTQLVQAIEPQVGGLVLVDNGSSGDSLAGITALHSENLELVRNPHNLGVAAALNQGFAAARRRGFEWVLALDQDALPASDMVHELCRAYSRTAHSEGLAIVAAQLYNPQIERWASFLKPVWGPVFRRSSCEGEVLEGVTTVVTAGALMRLAAVETLGGFREDFFIDYVDTEFCLRARSQDFEINVACRAQMQHRLGQRDRRRVGPIDFYPTHHAAERWYYFGRNRIAMLRMYALRFPHWLGYELVASMYTFARMILAESQRRQKIRALLRGTLHGFQGRMGEIPAQVLEAIQGRAGPRSR